MAVTPEPYREIALPVSTFTHLRRALSEEAGELPAIHALHGAGYAAGVAAAAALEGDGGEGVLALDEEEFWARLAAFLSRRGWGTLTHRHLHPAVGVLASADWMESTGAEAAEDASCSFTAGFLSGILTTLAGGPVAVLETSCRGRGDAVCVFAFGNAVAIHEVYGKLLAGTALPDAVAAL